MLCSKSLNIWTTAAEDEKFVRQWTGWKFRVEDGSGTFRAPLAKVFVNKGVSGEQNGRSVTAMCPERPDIFERPKDVIADCLQTIHDIYENHQEKPWVAMTHGQVTPQYIRSDFLRRGVEKRKGYLWGRHRKTPDEIASLELEYRALFDATIDRDYFTEWLFIDCDELPMPGGMSWQSTIKHLAEAGRAQLSRWFPMLNEVRGVYATSGSAGRTDKLKFRYIFPLDEAVGEKDLKGLGYVRLYNNSALMKRPVIDTRVYSPSQLIYIAQGVYPDGTHPLAGRTGRVGYLDGVNRPLKWKTFTQLSGYRKGK